MGAASMLRVENVVAHYGATAVLKGVSLQVEPGQSVCVLGRNGAGKTTLLRCIAGFTPCTSGGVWLGTTQIDRFPPHKIAESIAYVPQDNGLFPHLTVRQNLFLAVRNDTELQRRLEELDEHFVTMRPLLDSKAGTLSGGQQKYVAIARGVIRRPKLLLLDEPSAGLQPSIVLSLADLIRSLVNQIGLALLLVEQNRRLALNASADAYIMDRGEIMASGSTSELDENDQIGRYLSF